ncbi:hypothetical protein [Colwellia sp. MB02u-14]|uniref:hypothetical protein n=1 Tax=Colwellia sp. MB02u-14 TaxID=2759815 RepID=UPI0015F3F0D4|nr:hypothetical protein [Colwellia sp. MB02u-14]MBA6304979.1 hypothetical protein [Colwellia sp. MB02u-14]
MSPSTNPDAPFPNVMLIMPALATEVSTKNDKAHSDNNLLDTEFFMSKFHFSDACLVT